MVRNEPAGQGCLPDFGFSIEQDDASTPPSCRVEVTRQRLEGVVPLK
jgi:hypothetical protein